MTIVIVDRAWMVLGRVTINCKGLCTMKFDVFLSHNGKDKPAVETLAHKLEGKGSESLARQVEF